MWLFEEKEFTSDRIGDAVGFVYQIHNLTKDKFYIGKKHFRKRIKRKNKKVWVESDWPSYVGSNAELQTDIENGDEIKRYILHLAFSKGEMSYLEIKEQILHDVLFSEKFYNSYIGCRIHKKHMKANTKARI